MSAILERVALVVRSVRDLLLPRRCLVCADPRPGGAVRSLCDECLESIEQDSFEGTEGCPRCGTPSSGVCGPCAIRPPSFRSAASFGTYDGVTRDAVLRFKYAPEPALAEHLGRLVARAAERLPACDAIVPVPLHAARLRERGFNQASFLAREAGARMGVFVAHDALARIAATARQTRRSRTARGANVRRAITAGPRAKARVAGRTILLVDDVLTTGATANACADALLAAGAREVHVATVARATLSGPIA